MSKSKRNHKGSYPRVAGKAVSFEYPSEGAIGSVWFRMEVELPRPTVSDAVDAVTALGMYGCLIVETNRHQMTVQLPRLWNLVEIEENMRVIIDHMGRTRIVFKDGAAHYLSLFNVSVELFNLDMDVPLMKGWLHCNGAVLPDSEQLMDEEPFRLAWNDFNMIYSREEALQYFENYGRAAMMNYLESWFPNWQNPLLYWDDDVTTLIQEALARQEKNQNS